MASTKQEQFKNTSERAKELRNEDPISGEAGAHPVGTGIGAALGGAATGAVVGMAGGPVGTVIGAIAGGVAGGLAGKAVAESYDPTVETSYWKDEYRNRPYYNSKYSYEHYEPAYRAGWESYDAGTKADWQAREAAAREQWENEGGHTHMTWEEARNASQDAYDRVQTSNLKKSRPK
jgi:phage tail tape-measure protein